MTVNALFVGTQEDWDTYAPALIDAFANLGTPVALQRDHAAETVDYIVMAGSRILDDFSPFVRCKAMLRLWAGVEDVVNNPTITFPICRMVGGGLDQGMIDWVTAHTLRHHIGMDTHIHGQDGVWRDGFVPPLAQDRPITILGLGALGAACGQALAGLGFPVTGWSRTQKSIPNIRCLSGDVGDALDGAEIVILLLPKTPQTENTLNAGALSRTAKGAFILNPGRGPLIDDDALIAALDSGQIAHATLDTFRQEPLPEDHPFWHHPQVTVTPHIASQTRADPAAKIIAQNIQRGESGEEFLHQVDRTAGY
ncbi:2-hydroxyacid dehydrogenase [Pseudooctadecabacter jejudonensis]|uniref:Glyoxylate/hydroxypyruvate reductase A n=1 Tax=Pseudooctadecabacter jejudonensis TaxID=1391910 RepID=A0A1Y5SRX0_9RHOB|nr:glyoxylate/hydroxypyruvate reductase A [Pseudooctadecabacter jejudonensis]SLN47032.1 Glyoxylate/hydroxypyruvate reductase A [Pseudooctadecabacter jejudonensis]